MSRDDEFYDDEEYYDDEDEELEDDDEEVPPSRASVNPFRSPTSGLPGRDRFPTPSSGSGSGGGNPGGNPSGGSGNPGGGSGSSNVFGSRPGSPLSRPGSTFGSGSGSSGGGSGSPSGASSSGGSGTPPRFGSSGGGSGSGTSGGSGSSSSGGNPPPRDPKDVAADRARYFGSGGNSSGGASGGNSPSGGSGSSSGSGSGQGSGSSPFRPSGGNTPFGNRPGGGSPGGGSPGGGSPGGGSSSSGGGSSSGSGSGSGGGSSGAPGGNRPGAPAFGNRFGSGGQGGDNKPGDSGANRPASTTAPAAPAKPEQKKDDKKPDDKAKPAGGPASGAAAALGGLGAHLPFGGKKDDAGAASGGDKKPADKPASGGSSPASSAAAALGGITSRLPFGGKKDDAASGGDKKPADKAASGGSSPASSAAAALGGITSRLPFGGKKDDTASGGDKKPADKPADKAASGGPTAALGGLGARLPFGGKKDEAPPAAPKKDDKKDAPAKPAAGGKKDDAKAGASDAGGKSSPFGRFRGGSGAANTPPPAKADAKSGGKKADTKNAKAEPAPGGIFSRLTAALPFGRAEEAKAPAKTSKTRASKVPQTVNEGMSLDTQLDILGVGLVFGALVIFFSALSGEQGAITGSINNAFMELLGRGAFGVPVIMLSIGVWLIVRHFGETAPVVDLVRIAGLGMLYVGLLVIFQYLDSFRAIYRAVDVNTYKLLVEQMTTNAGSGGGEVGAQIYIQLLTYVGDMGSIFVILGWMTVGLMLATRTTAAEIAVFVISIYRSFVVAMQHRAQRAAAKRAEAQLLAAQQAEAAKLAAAQAQAQIAVTRPEPEALPQPMAAPAAALPAPSPAALPEPEALPVPIEQRGIPIRIAGQMVTAGQEAAPAASAAQAAPPAPPQTLPQAAPPAAMPAASFQAAPQAAPSAPLPAAPAATPDSGGRGGLAARLRGAKTGDNAVPKPPVPTPASAEPAKEAGGGLRGFFRRGDIPADGPKPAETPAATPATPAAASPAPTPAPAATPAVSLTSPAEAPAQAAPAPTATPFSRPPQPAAEPSNGEAAPRPFAPFSRPAEAPAQAGTAAEAAPPASRSPFERPAASFPGAPAPLAEPMDDVEDEPEEDLSKLPPAQPKGLGVAPRPQPASSFGSRFAQPSRPLVDDDVDDEDEDDEGDYDESVMTSAAQARNPFEERASRLNEIRAGQVARPADARALLDDEDAVADEDEDDETQAAQPPAAARPSPLGSPTSRPSPFGAPASGDGAGSRLGVKPFGAPSSAPPPANAPKADGDQPATAAPAASNEEKVAAAPAPWDTKAPAASGDGAGNKPFSPFVRNPDEAKVSDETQRPAAFTPPSMPAGSMPTPTNVPPPERKTPVVMQPGQSATAQNSPAVNATPAPAPRARRTWRLPDYRALLASGSEQDFDKEALVQRARTIEETLQSFGAPGRVVEINTGPVITQFGVEPDYLTMRGGKKTRVKVGAIAQLDKDLQLSLGARSIRVEAPVPGKGYVGIEVPNEQASVVSLRDVMEAKQFQKIKSPLAIALGQSVDGTPVAADLTTMPHLLIAGTTGSGKSVCVNAIITSLILQNTPDQVKFIMVDPKRVELTGYNGIPHLVAPVVVELERIVGVLKWVTREMDERYKKFSEAGSRNIEDYNANIPGHVEPLPYIVVIIDELADLMMLAPEETERVITRIAALARATGIHLVIATQRPSVDVVTGLIKANFPARIAFAVAGSVDSRVILDQPGAERLLGRGDMLYMSGDSPAPLRLQGVYVSDAEINNITRFWRGQQAEAPAQKPITALVMDGPAQEPRSVIPRGDRFTQTPPPSTQSAFWDDDSDAPSGSASSKSGGSNNEEGGAEDELYTEAVEMVRRLGKASVSLLQRRLRIGYTRAARMIDTMEAQGIIGPPTEGSKPREVLK